MNSSNALPNLFFAVLVTAPSTPGSLEIFVWALFLSGLFQAIYGLTEF